MNELVMELQKLVGAKIPKGTLRQWAHQGIISGPKSYGVRGRRGCFYDWPEEAFIGAGVVYTLRHTDIPWARSIKGHARVTTLRLLAAKKIVDRYYAAICEFAVTGDLAVFLETYDRLHEPSPSFFVPPNKKGYMFGSADLHPLVIYWIVTFEKIKHDKPLYEPVRVIFNIKSHFIDESGRELRRPVYDGVSFETSDENFVGLSLYKF